MGANPGVKRVLAFSLAFFEKPVFHFSLMIKSVESSSTTEGFYHNRIQQHSGWQRTKDPPC
jgi:hypothetical protein